MMSWRERARRRGGEIPPEPRREVGALSPARAAWLSELLRDADASPRPTPWERTFLQGIQRNFDAAGSDLMLTEGQHRVLRQIEEKIHAAG
jgi:hypothetical protein